MKILVVRFSSIGDIVLTSPVVRCIKQQIPNVELHFLTKKSFKSIVSDNPYIDQCITIEKSINEVIDQLKREKYDFIVDLHQNVRTLSLKLKLRVPNATFPKLQIKKWLLVNFKKEIKTKVHIVDRYFKAVEKLNVHNDGLPCDFFIAPQDEINIADHGLVPGKYISFAIGAQFATKRMPVAKMIEVLKKIQAPVVLLGGNMDYETGEKLTISPKIINFCGKFNLQGSASIVKQSKILLTHDTGLMHIASAFQIPIVSVWGNTVPDLGMFPYYPSAPEKYSIHEVQGLTCRPCSKIGFQSCPKKHFNCMQLQNAEVIATDTLDRFSS